MIVPHMQGKKVSFYMDHIDCFGLEYVHWGKQQYYPFFKIQQVHRLLSFPDDTPVTFAWTDDGIAYAHRILEHVIAAPPFVGETQDVLPGRGRALALGDRHSLPEVSVYPTFWPFVDGYCAISWLTPQNKLRYVREDWEILHVSRELGLLEGMVLEEK